MKDRLLPILFIFIGFILGEITWLILHRRR
jgi:hypothetical protein